ncbi:hypothetical protein ACWD6P_09100 [Streptomyces sp. NPDC002446]
MIDQNLDDVTGPATLQMPQQAPPINRTAARPQGAGSDAPGVEADVLPWLWDDWDRPWGPDAPMIVA